MTLLWKNVNRILVFCTCCVSQLKSNLWVISNILQMTSFFLVISHDFLMTMKGFQQTVRQFKHKPFNTSQQPQINHWDHTGLYNATNSLHEQHILKFSSNTKHLTKRYKSAKELELIDKICKCNKALLISSLFWNAIYTFSNINTINIIIVVFTSDISSIAITIYALQCSFFVSSIYYSFLIQFIKLIIDL